MPNSPEISANGLDRATRGDSLDERRFGSTTRLSSFEGEAPARRREHLGRPLPKRDLERSPRTRVASAGPHSDDARLTPVFQPVSPICHTWRRLFLCGVLRVDLRRTMLGREPEPPVPPLIRIERRPAEAGTGRIPSLARLPVSRYQVCAVPVCSGANAPRRGRRRAAFRSTAHVPRGSSVYSRGAEHMGRRHLPARGAIRQGSRASAPRLPRWYGPERDAPQRVRQRSALPAAHRTTLGPA